MEKAHTNILLVVEAHIMHTHTHSVYVFIGACEVRPTCTRIAALRSTCSCVFVCVLLCICHEYPKSDLTELSTIDIAGHDEDVDDANDDENNAQRSRLRESRRARCKARVVHYRN